MNGTKNCEIFVLSFIILKMKLFLFLFGWLALSLLSSCNNSKSSEYVPVTTDSSRSLLDSSVMEHTHIVDIPIDSVFERSLIDTIMTLKEVEEAHHYIDSFSKHKRGVAFTTRRSDVPNEYEVAAGYNGEEHFETYYLFYIDSVTKRILVLDGPGGEKMTLSQWRKKERR